MKPPLVFLSGVIIGVAITLTAYQFVPPKPAPAPPPVGPPEASVLRHKLADQSNQIARLKTEQSALLDSLSNVVATTATPAPPRRSTTTQASADAPPADSAGAGRAGGLGKMIKIAMQQQIEMKLAAMKARLHLTDEQAQVVRELLEKQLGGAGDMATKMFEGKASKEELAAKPAVNLDAELKKILTPSQWDDYHDYQIEERQTQSQLVANAETLQLQSLLQLSTQQAEQIKTVIAEQTVQQLNASDGGVKMSGDWEQMLNTKRDAIRTVLTPEQQQSYDKFVESQREMIKSLMSGGKPAAP